MPLNLSGISTPKRLMSEEEIGKAYIESMIMLPEILQTLIEQMSDMADSLSVLALYYEKKGLTELLFTKKDLEGSNGNAK